MTLLYKVRSLCDKLNAGSLSDVTFESVEYFVFYLHLYNFVLVKGKKLMTSWPIDMLTTLALNIRNFRRM